MGFVGDESLFKPKLTATIVPVDFQAAGSKVVQLQNYRETRNPAAGDVPGSSGVI
ncbi:MAG: hypothetical protein ACYC38_02610 [Eubacteriales bacterium]